MKTMSLPAHLRASVTYAFIPPAEEAKALMHICQKRSKVLTSSYTVGVVQKKSCAKKKK